MRTAAKRRGNVLESAAVRKDRGLETASDRFFAPSSASQLVSCCRDPRSVLVMFCRCGVRGLILAAGVGIQAALERHVIGEELKWNEMNEGRKPSGAFGNHKSLLSRDVAVRGRDCDGRAQRFQFPRGAENRAAT